MQYLGCSAFLWRHTAWCKVWLGINVCGSTAIWMEILPGRFMRSGKGKEEQQGCYLGCRMLLFKCCSRRWQHSHCKLRPWIAKKCFQPRSCWFLCPSQLGEGVWFKHHCFVSRSRWVGHARLQGRQYGDCWLSCFALWMPVRTCRKLLSQPVQKNVIPGQMK